MNRAMGTAAEYHRRTSYRRHQLTPHALDWAHAPRLEKRYPRLPRLPLSEHPDLPKIDYLRLASRAGGDPAVGDNGSIRPDFSGLCAVLALAHTVTARSMVGGAPFLYRSVASAGALYPFELYLAVHAADGVGAGVYHYDPLGGFLQQLRAGRVPVIPKAISGVFASIYITGIFFRSAWKYRRRAYRYVLLDAGHLLENLRLSLMAMGLPFSIHLDFDDDHAGLLLGLDPQREVCLVGVHLTAAGEPLNDMPQALAPLPSEILDASRVSDGEIIYDPILQVHRAGCQEAPGETVPTAHVDLGLDSLSESVTSWHPLPNPFETHGPDYVDVLRRRRSRRNFVPKRMEQETVLDVLALVARAVVAGPQSNALATGCLVGPEQALPAGFYLLDAAKHRVGLVAAGDTMASMAAACLDQMWLKNAAMHLLFISTPSLLDQFWGARGYRYAMIEAGRLGQQAYMAATALGLGACGIGAIYDHEAAAMLDLPGDAALFYLVGVGPIKKGLNTAI